MHVCHVMGDGRAGGGPTVVLTLCRELRARGHTVSVVTQRNSALAAQCTALAIPVRELDFEHRRGVILLGAKLKALLREISPDIVHAHGARSALPVATLGKGRPGFVYTVHGFHHPAKRLPARVAGRALQRFCIARSDATIFVSKNDARQSAAERLGGRGRSHVIYNGVSVPDGLAIPEDERDIDLLYMARLVPQKDPLIIPEILLAMRPARPSLLIVGSGELEAPLREKIARLGIGDQVTLRPAVSRDEALRIIARTRVYLLPSLWEGLPVSVVEAMRLRIAVLASDVAGTDEVVIDGVTGLLAPRGDPAAFARQARILLSDPDRRVALTTAAEAAIADRFSTTRQVEQHLALYAGVMA